MKFDEPKPESQTEFGGRALLTRTRSGDEVAVTVPCRQQFAQVDALDYDVAIELDVQDDTVRLVVTRFECWPKPGGPTLSATGLKKIPLGRIVDAAIRLASGPPEVSGFGPLWRLDTTGQFKKWATQNHSQAIASLRRGGEAGRPKLTPKLLRRVAEAHRSAEKFPNKAVQHAMTVKGARPVSMPTVKGWVAAARSRTDPSTGKPYLAAKQKGK